MELSDFLKVVGRAVRKVSVRKLWFCYTIIMKTIAGLILVFLTGSMFVGLFPMSMDMDTTGCPFMAHEEVLCPMDLADHIGAWKSAFLAVTPTIFLLLVMASAVALATSFVPHLFVSKLRPIPLLRRQLRERTYTFLYRSLQELFSSGILHPKVF